MYPLNFEFGGTEVFLGVQVIVKSILCKKDNVEMQKRIIVYVLSFIVSSARKSCGSET